MKISNTVLLTTAAVSGSEKKVPPRHPLQRLGRLVEFTGEILNSEAFQQMANQSIKWTTMWEMKFANNANWMERNFDPGNQRCGFIIRTCKFLDLTRRRQFRIFSPFFGSFIWGHLGSFEVIFGHFGSFGGISSRKIRGFSHKYRFFSRLRGRKIFIKY